MNILDVVNFIVKHWGEILAVGASVISVIQAFQIEVLKKQVK